MVPRTVSDFLKQLRENNNREWFAANKAQFVAADQATRNLFETVGRELQKTDSIEKVQIFRIYRDVRFSKDKSPYKNYFSVWFSRTKPFLRGSYYLHIEPGNCFVEGGFWEPEPADLKRIRKEFELDATEIREIIATPDFKKYFTGIEGQQLKTAPKDFNKDHPAIDLIKKKQFLIIRRFSDSEALSPRFGEEIIRTFIAMRPFFDYMSDVLTTNLNGESVIQKQE